MLVTAALVTLTGCAGDFGPQWVDEIDFIPDSLHLDVGESAVLDVAVRDQSGNDITDEWAPYLDWSVVGPPVVEFEVTAEGRPAVRALETGEAFVQAELGRATRTLPVWIPPGGLDTVMLGEDPIIMSSREQHRVEFTLLDTLGVPMAAERFRVSWRVVDTTLAEADNRLSGLGTVRLRGRALPSERREGSTRLIAQVNARRFTFPVTVTAEPVGPREAPVVVSVPGPALQIFWRRNLAAREGYRVDRATSPAGDFTTVGRTPGGGGLAAFDTTWVDATAEPGVRYDYRVHACNAFGCARFPSPIVSGMIGG